jgi:acyl-CoA synthetase (AMP-forming)/AMP-acid ligase II
MMVQGADLPIRNPEKLREYCKKMMASFKSPRLVEFLTEIPKAGQGKVDKRQLLECR